MGLQGTVIRKIFQTATSLGAAYDTLCEMTELSNEEISNSENMVEWEKAALIWVPLLKITGDPLIGLHVGMGVNTLLNGMVGFLIQSCKDLDHGFQTFCRYSRMVSPMVEYKYTCDDVATLEMEQNKMWVRQYPEPARHALDFTLISFLNTGATLTGKKIVPLRVESVYEKRNASEYRDLFGCEVLFNRDINRIVLKKEDMFTPILTNDQSMFQLFNSIVAEKYAAQEIKSVSESCKQLLFLQFKGRIPSIEEAAAALNLSPRNLQHKLLEEKTSFRQIAGEVRKEIAFQLMKNRTIKISEISEILGYSDLSAFRKAFKSWTNATPKEIRKVQLNE
jgi:AraC-like DNA-binding protein